MPASRVLIIDDDRKLAGMLVEYLSARGYQVSTESSAENGLAAMQKTPSDAVILDLTLPDLDGLEVCRRLRATSDVPILMLTARGEPADRVVGLELGADDYLPKPFDPRELVPRFSAIQRRRAPPETSHTRFGRLGIAPDAREARLDGEL